MLTKENYNKVLLLRKRLDNHLKAIHDIDDEIKGWERVKRQRLVQMSIDAAQLDEIAKEEVPEDF